MILFLRLLRCFSSPGSPPDPMNSDRDTRSFPWAGGLPHSEIPGSTIARISPGLVAACHVLHRLSVPRHPPDALRLRLIRGGRRHNRRHPPENRRAQGQNPHSSEPREAGAHDVPPRMKTLPGQANPASHSHRQPPPRARARPPRSHHKLSLHPSINTPRRPPAKARPRPKGGAIPRCFSERRPSAMRARPATLPQPCGASGRRNSG